MNELHVSEEELMQLRSTNKKLSQECAENQQMIAVLEMQRDILAKSVRNGLKTIEYNSENWKKAHKKRKNKGTVATTKKESEA